ncbi:hypothetical protein [Paenibacillus sp. FSL H7-689]|uniref:hypothetical protein n=1 Tax=Paenibacillus sp. FSL H7-689 TaxID=1227349 RepID=UPI0003E21F0D|nr:hypothetical protein [Paenibacillus sp. FSL H7-689]ETT41933.1 hypothetical protein C170_29138 [Paenibacillus sp. FSL H7-689]
MDLPYEHAKRITFTRRKVPVSPEYRPLTKIAQIVLVLSMASRGNSANLLKFQLLNWAFKSKERDTVLLMLIQDPLVTPPLINMDPSVNRALQFAVADKLISFSESTGKFTLSTKGTEFAKAIIKESSILISEKALLSKIGLKVTDKVISTLFKERLV